MKKAFLALISSSWLLAGGLLAFPPDAAAKPWWLNGSAANSPNTDQFLPPDAAFRISSVTDGDLIRVRWIIADGYYLYRSKFDIRPESPDLALEPAVFPPGATKTDEYFGTQEIFQHEVTGVVAFKRSDAGAHPLQIRVTYQGCAEAGLCYQPIVKVLSPDALAAPAPVPVTDALPITRVDSSIRVDSGNDAVIFAILGGTLAFFIAGLYLRGKHKPAAL